MKKARVDVGTRVVLDGTPFRGVVAKRINNVVLVYRDDSDHPEMVRVSEVIPI